VPDCRTALVRAPCRPGDQPRIFLAEQANRPDGVKTPADLSTSGIASERYVSPNTVKTHIRNLYAKLGTHRRGEAVERARALGLLAPSARRH
jgi:hypothetical protein